MQSIPIPPRAEDHHSRELIAGARRRIASAKALIAYSRQAIARQRFLQVVCASWCQQLLGWERHERHAQRCWLCAVRDHGGGGVGVSAGKRCTIAS
jgi:hypothetical protein